MMINCAIWLIPSIALLLEAVPGHGAPGDEWSRQDQPRGLNHIGTSRVRLGNLGSITQRGSTKLSSERQCSFPVVPGQAARRVRCCLLLGRYLFCSGSIISEQLTKR